MAKTRTEYAVQWRSTLNGPFDRTWVRSDDRMSPYTLEEAAAEAASLNRTAGYFFAMVVTREVTEWEPLSDLTCLHCGNEPDDCWCEGPGENRA